MARGTFFCAGQGCCAGVGVAPARALRYGFANGPAVAGRLRDNDGRERKRRNAMAWTTPTLVEVCIGLEINGYLPAEF
jgi:coenzyme PQQ precursor peptide PqqA